MLQLGLDISFSKRTVKWLETEISMKTSSFWQNPYNLYYSFIEDNEDFDIDEYLQEILPSKYESVQIDTVIQQQKHLTSSQKNDLRQVLNQFTTLFNGKLGCYPHAKVHLQLKPDAKPYHARPYAVPHIHRNIFKNELDRLVLEGVLEPCGASEWAAPTFIVPKKDGRVRWVSDFRQLNANIIRKIYPLPRITDILARRKGYKFFTKLDISMQYYTFMLDDESSDLCIIVTPFGKYRYKRLPMGVKQSPDIAQEIMESIFKDIIHAIEVYIDDVGCFSNSWEEHMQLLTDVLQRLQDAGFTINPLKCEWAVQETDWLGYWLTPNGLKPWSKKIRSILALQPPQDMKQLRSFIGAVTYYRDMWPRRSHILAPLTELTGTKHFIWTDVQQKAFDQMKAIIARETLLYYPDHNKPFHIFTDASDYQLGSTIIQDGHPVAYYSHKLNHAQRNYTVMEKELLSIVSTLLDYRTMLLGADIHIYTDHKNLTYTKLNSQRVLRWRLLLEDYSPTFHYLHGSDNILADALSRLPIDMKIIEEAEQIVPNPISVAENFSLEQDDYPLFECLLHHPNLDYLPFPLDYAYLLQQQQQDLELRHQYQHNTRFIFQSVTDDIQLIAYQSTPASRPLIVIPSQILHTFISWHHLFLDHPGTTRLRETIATNFYHPRLQSIIDDITKRCDTCQRYKLPQRGYGHLPPRQVSMVPWQNVAVDLIGPWSITIDNQTIQLRALTAIDTDTNLAEAATISNPDSAHVANKFEQLWLSRYPRPSNCIHDPGPEFTGDPFQALLARYGIKDTPTTIKNPQANAVCERLHQTIGNMLRTLIYQFHPATHQEFIDLLDSAIANTIFALRATIHTTLQTTPGILAFHRDMLLNIPLNADLIYIQQNRQHLVNRNAERQNIRRHQYVYHINDQILIATYKPTKMQPRFHGPYQILQVHNNGTVTIQRQPNVSQRINIRRIRPYFT